MAIRVGSGYEASSNLQTSVANLEILPSPPVGWTQPYNFYKFSFLNDQDCHVIINNDGKQKFLRGGQGLSINEVDFPITSFKIVENSITFNWFGSY